MRGAEESGYALSSFSAREMNLHGCIGCGGCQRNGGTCVQKDDMQDIYEAVMVADVIVFAFPVYFYTWNAQVKMIADRLYSYPFYE